MGKIWREIFRSDSSSWRSKIHSQREQAVAPLQRRSSLDETVALYQQGNSLEQIMQIRQLAKSTILTHLAEAIQQGIDLDLASFDFD